MAKQHRVDAARGSLTEASESANHDRCEYDTVDKLPILERIRRDQTVRIFARGAIENQ